MIPTTLDRMFFVNYVRSYSIMLTCLLSLYIILDLFTNLDDFSGRGFQAMLLHVFKYYSTRISQIFDRLSIFLPLLGAVFTVVWMQRNNELLPQLSAGISTRRVLRPILFGSMLTIALGPINQEFIIPEIAEDLTTPRDDPNLERPTEVKGAYDSTGIHMEGVAGFRNEQKIIGLFVTLPENGSTGMVHLSAREAVYIPPGNGPQSGGWMLYQTTPDIEGPLPPNLERITYGKYFLKTREVDFETVTRGANWYQFASTPKLRELLAKPEARRQPQVAVLFHMRLTQPLLGVILLIMGLAVILRDPNRHVFINAALCIMLCAIFYVSVLGCKYLGEHDFIAPALAAWLPVLVFGPISLALFDAIHT